jgi:hypothetical protein
MTSALSERERRNPQMYNLKTQVAFHGTLTRSLPSIVQKGLVIPGEGNTVKVRCGSSLGVGIYLSPSPDFSLNYTDSNRLIVCAALLGRLYQYGSTKNDSNTHACALYMYIHVYLYVHVYSSIIPSMCGTCACP